ncbi:PEP-CTERM sorting domain-containing protein [Colwellia sp. MSW7]|uniref:PEP-CTERM sorting domain-containing protein n=1 Tax=Colwellia maritima TaxID=2912588 RepID=A0ABS9WXN4_9GAMM|nr:PEP-CTERM sorting domain-containing protein [Colwellia maritima]MCI2282748.1 PEP-CTERM sorting domain-containing protein [Colwellia maritima]
MLGALAFGKATAVPLPRTLMLFLTGILGLVVRRKNS